MIPRKILFMICLVVSVLSLAAGYWLTAQWIGILAAIVTGLGWLSARKHSATELPMMCLFVSVGLAVVGLILGAPPILMLCGSGFALAAWDLISLEDVLKNSAYEQQTMRYENKHLQLLALGLGGGLVVSLIGRLLHFQIHFVVLLVLVGLVILGLDRVWIAIKKRNIRNVN